MTEPKPIDVTVMFADICRSTFLFDELGDEPAAQLVSGVLARAARVIEQHGGTVLRTKGDDILCIFDHPRNALQAALGIHRCTFEGRGARVSMRIGINSGNALLADGDLLGDSVNVAARLAQCAKAGQTIVAAHTANRAGPVPSGLLRPLGEMSLKGKHEPLAIFEILDTDGNDEITQVGSLSNQFPRSTMLLIQHRSLRFRLDYRLRRFLLGRMPDCDLVVDHPLVSRHHAEIRHEGNEFVVDDFSTNGTEILVNGAPRLIHRARSALRGTGAIYLGRTMYSRDLEITFEASGGSRPVQPNV